MNQYQLFIQTIRQELLCALSPDIEPKLHQYLRNNDVEQDYITFVPTSASSNPGIYPSMALKPLYERYCAGADIPKIISDILDALANKKTVPDIRPEQFENFDLVKDYICLKLINLKNNVRLLQNTPFISYYDLALVCVYYRAASDQDNTSSALIKNDYLSIWNIDKKTLFEWAIENTPRLMQPEILPVRELMDQMPGMDPSAPHVDLYILTNKQHYLGAVCMFFPGLLEKLSEEYQADLVLLPSSIHEFIIAPDHGDLPQDLNEIIAAVNREAVEVSERLSDHYYYYDRLKKIIRY